jgi:SAM-dependent methyltransferase
MTNTDYEYRGLLAKTWDLFRGDTSSWEDKFFYEKVIQKYGQPVLDVGCGTGRLLLDYLENGIDVDGIDISPEMLILCREKAHLLGLHPTLYHQGMEELYLPRKYRTIIVPSLSFQLVADTSLAAQAMSRFYKHLTVGGALVIPLRIFWEEGDPIELEWKMLDERIRSTDGAKVRHWAHATFDGENQLQHTEDRYEVLSDGNVIESEHHKRSPALRWYTQDQALKLYRDAGFASIQILRGFEDLPASASDTVFTIIGIR